MNPDLHSRFTPDLTPDQMDAMGVLRHPGSQYGHGTDKDNFFGVSASMQAWPEGWHNEEHPQGWYQWYKGYAAGKRTEDDERQIKRWLSFKARHLAQLQKADPTLSDLSIQPKRRQALLNWGIAPGVDLSNLEKKASILALGAHALLTHVGQNVVLKKALRSKALATHVANGFHRGTQGIKETGLLARAKRLAAGAALPEVNLLHDHAHELGSKLGPHLSSMTLRDKAALHNMAMGRMGPSTARQMESLRTKLPSDIVSHIPASIGLGKNPAAKRLGLTSDLSRDKATPLVSNIVKNIHKSKLNPAAKTAPGHYGSSEGFLGSLVVGIADPVAGVMNATKTALGSKAVSNNKYGGKVVEYLDKKFVREPFQSGAAHGTHTGTWKGRAEDLFLNPLDNNIRNVGNASRNAAVGAGVGTGLVSAKHVAEAAAVKPTKDALKAKLQDLVSSRQKHNSSL